LDKPILVIHFGRNYPGQAMFSLDGTLLGFYQLKTLIEGSKGRTHVLINDLTSVWNCHIEAECFTSESKL